MSHQIGAAEEGDAGTADVVIGKRDGAGSTNLGVHGRLASPVAELIKVLGVWFESLGIHLR